MSFKMPSQAHPFGLKLRVKELDRALTFYTGLLGLEQQEFTPGEAGEPTVRLGLDGRNFYLDLEEDARAPERPYPSVGLYHFALLLPDRGSLAQVFRKLVNAGWNFEGAADHAVSEAIYLRDPERNGIELYRDRPKAEWPVVNGRVAMVTEPLDLYGMLDEAPEGASLHPHTHLGHMHLHVDDLQKASAFYSNALGLETRASLPGADFLAAGDYHHHLGLNTWAGSRKAAVEATGLLSYTWQVPAGTLNPLSQRLTELGVRSENGKDLKTVDPTGIEVRFTEEATSKKASAMTEDVNPARDWGTTEDAPPDQKPGTGGTSQGTTTAEI